MARRSTGGTGVLFGDMSMSALDGSSSESRHIIAVSQALFFSCIFAGLTSLTSMVVPKLSLSGLAMTPCETASLRYIVTTYV